MPITYKDIERRKKADELLRHSEANELANAKLTEVEQQAEQDRVDSLARQALTQMEELYSKGGDYDTFLKQLPPEVAGRVTGIISSEHGYNPQDEAVQAPNTAGALNTRIPQQQQQQTTQSVLKDKILSGLLNG